MISKIKILAFLILLSLLLNAVHVLAEDSDSKKDKDSDKKKGKDSDSKKGKDSDPKKDSDSKKDEAGPADPDQPILISCGSMKDTNFDSDGRKWTSDKKFLANPESSTTVTADFADPTLPSQEPYISVRIFNTPSSYKFAVSPNKRLWIRLHFYPSSYNKLDQDKAYFSVTANGVTLLNNFSATAAAFALTQCYVVREFSLTPVQSGNLNLTITPSQTIDNSYAIVNGIEVIPMPELFDTTPLVGFQDQTIDVHNSSVQTMYRLTVGGKAIPATEDSAGGNRTWYEDYSYLIGAPATKFGITTEKNNQTINYPNNVPEYIAPPAVYNTARSMGPSSRINQHINLTWVFEVDTNFTYVVRLHFCELEFDKVNQRVFSIYLNNHTAETEADVIAWAKGKGVPVYKDYAFHVNHHSAAEEVWVALHPNEKTEPEFYDSLLNGLEIFKINDTHGNLAGPNPVPVQRCFSNEFLTKKKADGDGKSKIDDDDDDDDSIKKRDDDDSDNDDDSIKTRDDDDDEKQTTRT